MKEVTKAVIDWASEVFPEPTLDSITLHMVKEMLELRTAVKNGQLDEIPYEAADLVMMLMHLADLQGFDLEQAVYEKLAINKTRTWLPPDEHGVIEHKRD